MVDCRRFSCVSVGYSRWRFKSVVLIVITIDLILSINLKRCLLEITVLISTIEYLCLFTVINVIFVWKVENKNYQNSLIELVIYKVKDNLSFVVRSHTEENLEQIIVGLNYQLRGSLTFNKQFLVISIIIDCDRGHCYEHFKKKI